MHRLKTTAAIFAIPLGVAILVALPALKADGGPGAVALGSRTVDALGTWWYQWWVDGALANDRALDSSNLLFHPWGKDIFHHTGGNVLDSLAAVPLRRVFGPTVAWNLLYIVILTLNGAVTAAWARARGARWVVATAAAAAVVVHPYPLFELAEGRPTQAMLFPLIAALALADSAFESSQVRRGVGLAVAAGACLAVAGWTYWFGAGFAALAVLLLSLGRPLGQRLLRLAVVGGAAILLTAPAVLPLAKALASNEIPGLLPVDEWLAGDFLLVMDDSDPVVMATLGHHWMAGFLTKGRWLAVAPTLGVVAALLALPAGLRSWRWVAVAGLALALAVGPLPAGHENPIYFALMAVLLPMRRLYWPVRALVLLAPIAAVGTMALARRLPPRTAAIAWLVPLALAGEAWTRGQLPLDTWSPEVPRAYECLAAEEGAIIELPYGTDHDQLLHQTVHGLPIFGGMNERSHSLVPLAQQEARRDNTWLRALLVAAANPRDRSEWTEEDQQAVRDLGYRWVVLRLAPIIGEDGAKAHSLRMRVTRMRMEELVGPPVYRDQDTMVYSLDNATLSCDVDP